MDGENGIHVGFLSWSFIGENSNLSPTPIVFWFWALIFCTVNFDIGSNELEWAECGKGGWIGGSARW